MRGYMQNNTVYALDWYNIEQPVIIMVDAKRLGFFLITKYFITVDITSNSNSN